MFVKKIDTSAAIHSLLASRWSGVAFDPERFIGDDDLRSMIEAARWAPTAFGDEPWRFVVCNKATSPESWRRAFECLGEGNKTWCENVPVLLLVCHDTALTRNDKPNPWAQYDTGAASVSLALQAASLGIMSVPTCIFFKDGKEVDRFQGNADLRTVTGHIDRVLG